MISLALSRLRYAIRTYVATKERLYMPLASLKRNDGRGLTPVDRSTELTLEAFPRSGNTFAYEAFTRAQASPVRVAHHSHAPAQVIRAVRLGIPVCVIIRPAKDAVASLLIREPLIGVRQAVNAWLSFYETLAPLNQSLIIATFDQVTSDFGLVVERINARFDTRFVPFSHTASEVKDCFDAIDARNRLRFGRGTVQKNRVARPSFSRNLEKASRMHEFDDHASLFVRAESVFNQFECYARCIRVKALY
jgi:hypothetical protein